MSVLKLKQNGVWVPISVGAQGRRGDTGAPGAPGATGTTFTPSVSEDGTLSWTNDGGKTNPASVNIKGPQGAQGPQGEPGTIGPQGPAGKTPVKGTDYFTEADKNELVNSVLTNFTNVSEVGM